MPQKPADRFFGALNEAYDTMLHAIDRGNQRGYRVSKTILRQARRGERELVALARKWVEEPTDLLGFYEDLLDAQLRAQTRALELAREWLADAGDTREEVQEALRRLIEANRQAGEAAVEAARSAFGRGIDWAQGREPPAAEEAPPTARKRAPRTRSARAARGTAPRPRAATRPADGGGSPGTDAAKPESQSSA
jgi:hypothetical protein